MRFMSWSPSPLRNLSLLVTSNMRLHRQSNKFSISSTWEKEELQTVGHTSCHLFSNCRIVPFVVGKLLQHAVHCIHVPKQQPVGRFILIQREKIISTFNFGKPLMSNKGQPARGWKEPRLHKVCCRQKAPSPKIRWFKAELSIFFQEEKMLPSTSWWARPWSLPLQYPCSAQAGTQQYFPKLPWKKQQNQ